MGGEMSFLGKPPWGKEHLRKYYFKDFRKTKQEINSLSGGIIYNEFKSLQLSLSIFLDSVDELIWSINKFKFLSLQPKFWYKKDRPFADKIEISIQRGILSSSMCAMSLVAHTRKYSKKHPVKGYETKIKEFFKNSERHNFIQSLRNCQSHFKFTKANWKISHTKEGRNVYFLLNKQNLLEYKKWSQPAKKFISKHADNINIEELFYNYSKEVKEFHRWLKVALLNTYGKEISEYLHYSQIINKFNLESIWELLIQQSITNNIDPYFYLDEYLTENEIEEVLSLPYRSKKQVDKIIELVDSFRICTDALRKKIYKICKVAKQ
jgi:hypothetical protein